MDGVTYINDPYRGPVATTTQRNVVAGSAGVGNINTRLGPGGIDRLLETGELNESGVFGAPKARFTREQLIALVTAPPPRRRGSGRVGRPARAYDRDQLIESGTDRWKGIMFEDPDENAVGSLVDRFIDKGSAFWMKQGGNLDFDTYIVNEMRKTGRYKSLYAKKDPYLTEEEWMGRYRGAVEQFGFGEQATRRETEAGLKSGAGVAGFTERVSRTRESRLQNQGGFSRSLANQMSQMGSMG